MAKITRKELLALAELSQLQFTDQELDALEKDIESVLEYVARLSESPYAIAYDEAEQQQVETPLRADHVREFDADSILDQAPERRGDFFEVPAIIKVGER